MSQCSISTLCAAQSVHTQFLNAGLHLVWRAVIKWGFGCPRQPDNRNFPILMSSPRGSVLLVPPDLTAAMHLIWGNLENCSEVPASLLTQSCATGRGFLAGCGLSYSGNFLLLLSQQQQLAMDASVFRFGFRGSKWQRKHISFESWFGASPERWDFPCCMTIIVSLAHHSSIISSLA